MTVTPPSRIYFTNTSHTDLALSLAGKTRFSFSTLVAIPRALKKLSVFWTVHCEKAEKRNLPSSLNFSKNFLVSYSALVRLHRPPPVSKSFLPSASFFSIRATLAPLEAMPVFAFLKYLRGESPLTGRAPHSAARPAAIIPAGPPPTTTTSHILSVLGSI